MTDRPTPPLLAWGVATDAGRVRTGNEDCFVAEPMIFGVADGMGGHQAGEVASAIAAATLRDRLSGGAATVDVAVAAVVEANAAIFQGAHNNAEQRGMGTTLTALAVLTTAESSPRFALLNVGDSRTYVVRGGRMRRVSIDHSYVQELVSTGHITELEARNHPRRNIVTRALGIEPTVKVDTWVLPLYRGDRYLLCSDGLVDEVEDGDIAIILGQYSDPQAAAEALVNRANENGGRDNTTVIIVDVLEGDDPLPDTADLDVDLTWAEEQRDRLIEADPAETPDPTMAVPLPIVDAATVGTERASRKGLGVLLFGLAFAAIVVLTVTLVLVVRHNANDAPPATTTSTSSTTSTSTTSTTSTTTTTTTAPSTTAPPST